MFLSKKIILTILLVTISGCSTNVYYAKMGVSQQEVDRDAYICTQESMTYSSYSSASVNSFSGSGYSSSGSSPDLNLFTMCMRAKGYTVSNRPIQQIEAPTTTSAYYSSSPECVDWSRATVSESGEIFCND
ncbi:exported hypothetical protein [Vibrio diabolicus]|nr:exported hypothetical protein [Vibrio diabolicus]